MVPFFIMRGFNLRGTNGSGKTYVAREVLKWCHARPHIVNAKSKPITYRGTWDGLPVHILGSYETDCGGCDTIPSVKIVADLLETLWDEEGVVFYEGLMISHMIGTVGAAVRPWGIKHTMGFLDTPLEKCIERVVQRRVAAGNDKPFNPDRTLVKDYHAVELAKRNAIRQGFTVLTVPHISAVKFTLGYLNEMCHAR